MTNNTNSSKLHAVMFPWFAYGHFIPFLHLSNKLAERGHTVSFLLPKGAQPKLQHLNRYPNLIAFFPLVVPHVDGIPIGTETASDIPLRLHDRLFISMDKTKDQVETILSTIPKPHCIFFDFSYWIPELTRRKQYGSISIYFSVVTAATIAHHMVPARRIAKEMTLEEYMKPPPGYPSSTVVLKRNEVSRLLNSEEHVRNLVPFYNRLTTGMKESDAIAMRIFSEIEAQFCDYIAEQYKKHVLLTGPLLLDKSAGTTQLEGKWANWLNRFQKNSVVYCAFGSQIKLEKEQFQEMVLGIELTGFPFLVALTPPQGCSTIEEALPDGFQERIQGRGWVFGGWVPQTLILEHQSVGCFVSHSGCASLWESLLSDCQVVLIPHDIRDQIM